MSAAIEQAQIGLSEGGIPIGSVLVKDQLIVGRGRNRRVQDRDPVAHAEIDCLRNAGRIGGYRGATLYSTLTPCFMCAGAAIQFGIRKVVIGDIETYADTLDFLKAHGIEVVALKLTECQQMLADFAANNPDLWKEDKGDL
ncbi:MAG TPA: nucleoside deaminase [Candidatus Binataceae bacterium]|nr:nucleoside deaminase [Candidatus Binataceae bacterium]